MSSQAAASFDAARAWKGALVAAFIALLAIAAPVQAESSAAGSIVGTVVVLDPAQGTGTPVAGAQVQACTIPPATCWIAQTDASGFYRFDNLPAGDYMLTAFPPAGVNAVEQTLGPVRLGDGGVNDNGQFRLNRPVTLPGNVTVSVEARSDQGIPLVRVGTPFTVTVRGCPGGTATYTISRAGVTIGSGTLTEGPAGSYTAAVPPSSGPGPARVNVVIDCPGTIPDETTGFDIEYTDPSGNVYNVDGAPILGATVTLYRSDFPSGPFTVVPNGSAMMSPSNRRNPDLTDSAGYFRWDVLSGYYKVRAEKLGCVSPDDLGSSYVESGVEEVPPEVTGLKLILDCPPTQVSAADDVYAIVPGVLRLDICGPAFFGYVLPGLTREYFASTCAFVSSSAGDATLSVYDDTGNMTGHLVNGPHVMPAQFQVRATNSANPGATYGVVGSAANPLSLLSWSGPVGVDTVALDFRQRVLATDPLRRGIYGKRITYTLSTTQP